MLQVIYKHCSHRLQLGMAAEWVGFNHYQPHPRFHVSDHPQTLSEVRIENSNPAPNGDGFLRPAPAPPAKIVFFKKKIKKLHVFSFFFIATKNNNKINNKISNKTLSKKQDNSNKHVFKE